MFRCENVVTDRHYNRSECLQELSAKLNSLEEDYGDIQIIDIREVSCMADYFIIASGKNRNQVQAMADIVEEKLHEAGIHPRQIEGYQTANWILMDFHDVIVHIFNEEDRMFYNLEKIWLDGKVIDSDSLQDLLRFYGVEYVVKFRKCVYLLV